MLKKTPLHSLHQQLGARLVDFGGWEMPVQYSGIVDEHLAVRQHCGLFDISHMGEIIVSGHDAALFLNSVLTNNVFRLGIGQGQYTLMCQPDGGVVDDLYCYRIAPAEFLLIVNASRTDEDVSWLELCKTGFASAGTQGALGSLELRDASPEYAAVAVQGPRVVEFISQVFPGNSIAGTAPVKVTDLRRNQIGAWMSAGHRVWVARTGYTGEDGFEAFTMAAIIETLWNNLLAAGSSFGLKPCGLGARDTLRTEMGYPLYGHELDGNTSPLEAGLGKFVDLEKGDFIGSDALIAQRSRGVTRRCIAFRMSERSAPPRPGYPIHAAGHPVGSVVSGTQSPSLNTGIGMGYVPTEHAAPGTRIAIEIRGKTWPAEVTQKPIFKKGS